MESGHYLSAERARQTHDNEISELAAKLWYLRQDFSDAAHEANLLPLVNEVYREKDGFPDATAKLAQLLNNPEERAVILLSGF